MIEMTIPDSQIAHNLGCKIEEIPIEWEEVRPKYYHTNTLEQVEDGDLVSVMARGRLFLGYVDSQNNEDDGISVVEHPELGYHTYGFSGWSWGDVELKRKRSPDGSRASLMDMQ